NLAWVCTRAYCRAGGSRSDAQRVARNLMQRLSRDDWIDISLLRALGPLDSDTESALVGLLSCKLESHSTVAATYLQDAAPLIREKLHKVKLGSQLNSYVRSSDASIRVAAASAMWQFSDDPSLVLDVLVSVCTDESVVLGTREQAMRTLQEMNGLAKTCVPALESLAMSDPRIRCEVLRTLECIDPRSAEEIRRRLTPDRGPSRPSH